MNKHFDDQWKLLQQMRPTQEQKDSTRKRVLNSIQAHSGTRTSKHFLQWKSIFATTILLLICSAFLWVILHENREQGTASIETYAFEQFSWKLSDLYPEKSDDGLFLYRKGNHVEVGTVKEISEKDKNELVTQLPMFVEETLESFPYPMVMYIEHVKMQEVALRYHFFVEYTDEKWIHFTFDYPKLEYAEIFQAMSTIKFSAKQPYHHDKQLYITHGYGDLLYPVGLEPVSISREKEVYRWPNASTKVYSDYTATVVDEPGNWQQIAVDRQSYTFVHEIHNTELTITLDGKTLTYAFVYHYEEE